MSRGLPIIFSAPMVRALLSGTKAQTRRIIKPPYGTMEWLPSGEWKPIVTKIRPGDRLWVRETWTAQMTHGWTIADARSRMYREKIFYAADGKGSIDGWWPSIHMPREFSRLTLTVTDVRVQRLQDISEEDAWAEGCAKGNPDDVGGFFPAEEPDPSGIGYRGWDCARDWFADLWEGINGEGAWDANPWVVAYTFTVEHQNIDATPSVSEE